MLVQHTTDIFERMVRDMPPLVPQDVQKDARHALDHIKSNLHLDIDEVEDTMLTFGMKLWPYREAFLEFYKIYEGQLGEQHLLRILSREDKKAYSQYKEAGGTFGDLYSGKGPIHLFTSQQRGALCAALVTVRKEVWQYTKQAVLSKDKKKYEARIEEFEDIFEDIEKRLEAIREMAEDEQEHPELAAEMREHVRGFEHGLCLLGPKLDYAAVCNTDDHFVSRKEQRKLHQRV